jgi:hypothetical protein
MPIIDESGASSIVAQMSSIPIKSLFCLAYSIVRLEKRVDCRPAKYPLSFRIVKRFGKNRNESGQTTTTASCQHCDRQVDRTLIPKRPLGSAGNTSLEPLPRRRTVMRLSHHGRADVPNSPSARYHSAAHWARCSDSRPPKRAHRSRSMTSTRISQGF